MNRRNLLLGMMSFISISLSGLANAFSPAQSPDDIVKEHFKDLQEKLSLDSKCHLFEVSSVLTEWLDNYSAIWQTAKENGYIADYDYKVTFNDSIQSVIAGIFLKSTNNNWHIMEVTISKQDIKIE